MVIDPQSEEVARFKNALARLSLTEIRRRLDGSIIIRAWKRDLAEAEDGRREQETEAVQARSLNRAADRRRQRRDLSWRVWALVGGAIFAALSLIWTALPR